MKIFGLVIVLAIACSLEALSTDRSSVAESRHGQSQKCIDSWSKNKCKEKRRKDRCGKKNVKKNCKLTCGHCKKVIENESKEQEMESSESQIVHVMALTVENSEPQIAYGRPFTVEYSSRTTKSMNVFFDNSDDVESWRLDKTVSLTINSTYDYEIGLQWLQQAEGEHASIASFARHTLQLMSIGAPSELLLASQAASIDEIKHAKMCYGFASIFLHQDMTPGLFDVEDSLDNLEIKDIIVSVIREGCMEETLSAIEARFRGHLAIDLSVKAALNEISEDESKHAKLAWDTIQWIAKKHPQYQTFIQNAFENEFEKEKAFMLTKSTIMNICDDNQKDDYLRTFGILTSDDRRKVRQFGIQKIIKATYELGVDHFDSIFDKIKNLDVSLF